jgi:hypothetical protein
MDGAPLECAFCAAPAGADGLGPLLGPVSGTDYYVHRACALWAPEVHESEDGALRRVLEALRRGRQLRCAACGRRGAALGCRVERCPRSLHVACALAASAALYADHTAACAEHAPRFAGKEAHADPRMAEGAGGGGEAGDAEPPPTGEPLATVEPPGDAEPPATGEGARRGAAGARARLAEAAARAARARAVRKRARRDARRDAERGSDDEAHFAGREATRLRRDAARLDPVTLGGGPPGAGPRAEQRGGGDAGNTDGPVADAVRATTLADFAGAPDVVRQLREVVLLPLLYPALFSRLGAPPPRGVLLHGPPGTGKTLAARAIAGAAAAASPVPVAFFARKGADCLGQFVGEAERTLRLLFQEAERSAPALIFFDELDALAPPRRGGAGAGAQDAIHASVVSTLLALMDGLAGRGHVVVLAATNRPDGIDAALRRPGRFDREVRFALPDAGARAAILAAHTRAWPGPPGGAELARVAAAASGAAGADLAALCSAAVLAAARRAAPALLEGGGGGAAAEAARRAARLRALDGLRVEEGDWAAAFAAAPPPCARRAGLDALAADAARPLPRAAAPLLAPAAAALLARLGESGLPLPADARAAADAARGPAAAFEALLVHPGAAEPARGVAPPPPPDDAPPAAAPPARVGLLLAGEGELGQGLAAGALLRLLAGRPDAAVSLPALVARGSGDPAAGAAALVAEAAALATPAAPAVLFLPRLDSWAVEVLAEEAEEAVHGAGGSGASAADAGGAGGAPSPFAGLAAPKGWRAAAAAAGDAVVEAAALTEAWAVFVAALRQAPPAQPLLLLATAHRGLSGLPADLLAFFGAPGAAAELPAGAGGGAWAEAARRAAAAAAASAAGRAAAALLERLAPPAPEPAAGGEGGAGAGAEAEDGESAATDAANDTEALLNGGGALPGLNADEAARGRALHAQVVRFALGLGRALLRDRRARAAGAWAGGRRGAPRYVSFEGVGAAAAAGALLSLEALRGAAAEVAAAVAAAAREDARGGGGGGGGGGGAPRLGCREAPALAAALQDEVDARCHALWAALGLGDPAAARLAAAARADCERRARALRRAGRRAAPAAAAEVDGEQELGGAEEEAAEVADAEPAGDGAAEATAAAEPPPPDAAAEAEAAARAAALRHHAEVQRQVADFRDTLLAALERGGFAAEAVAAAPRSAPALLERIAAAAADGAAAAVAVVEREAVPVSNAGIARLAEECAAACLS